MTSPKIAIMFYIECIYIYMCVYNNTIKNQATVKCSLKTYFPIFQVKFCIQFVKLSNVISTKFDRKIMIYNTLILLLKYFLPFFCNKTLHVSYYQNLAQKVYKNIKLKVLLICEMLLKGNTRKFFKNRSGTY